MTRILHTLGALAVAAALAPAARADDMADLAGLLNEPVVSTASKSAESAALAPATTSVVTSDDLRRYAFTSLDEAIDFLGMGLLAERSYGTPEIGARGVLLTLDYGNHVLMLVDGHAVNEPWDGTAYHDQSAGVPLDLVDHVEVILGPGSVLYGSNAMFGVVNVITKRAKDYPGLHLVADGMAPLGAHLAGGYGQRLELLGRPAELTVGLDLHHTTGPGAFYAAQPIDLGGGQTAVWGGREATHRAVDVPSGYARLVIGEFDVALRAAQSRRTATQIWLSFDDPDNWERDRWLSLDVKWSRALTRRLTLGARLYGDLYDYLEHAPSASPNDCLGSNDCLFQNAGESRWAGAEVNVGVDWLDDGRFVTLLGVDGRLRRISSWSSYRDDVTGDTQVVAPYERSGWSLGAYVQQTAQLAPWLSLNAGARFDRDEDLTGHVSPRAALVLSAWTGGTVKGIYSEAFRAPSYFERNYADGQYWIAPQALSPEQVRSVELLVEQRLGAQRLRLGAFESWFADLVRAETLSDAEMQAAIQRGVLNPQALSGTVNQYRNAASVNTCGLNADWDGSALGQRLRYGAALTWARSCSGDPQLPAAAQAFGNVHGSYDLGPGLPTLALAVRYFGARPASQWDPSAPAAATADGSVQLHGALTQELGRGFALRAAATLSLTDQAPYAVGPNKDQLLPIPQLQALVGLRYDLQPAQEKP